LQVRWGMLLDHEKSEKLLAKNSSQIKSGMVHA